MASLRAVLVVAVLLTGCGAKEHQVLREGWSLLHHPAPGDPEWESRRATFLDDAVAFVGTDGKR